MTKNNKIIIGILAVLALLAIFITLDRKSKVEIPSTTATSTEITATTTTKQVGNTDLNVSGSGNFKVEQLPSVPAGIPDRNYQVVFSNLSLTPEIKAQIFQKITNLQSELKKDPSLFSDWINLGIYQKMAGDYNATITSWTYAGLLSPKNYVSFGDLGNLYAYFLNDNTKAENYYKQAIKNGPTQAYLYIQLAEVYRDIFKDNTKALAEIDLGLSKIPNDQSLLQFKANLNR